jgi:hypothetical protein
VLPAVVLGTKDIDLDCRISCLLFSSLLCCMVVTSELPKVLVADTYNVNSLYNFGSLKEPTNSHMMTSKDFIHLLKKIYPLIQRLKCKNIYP